MDQDTSTGLYCRLLDEDDWHTYRSIRLETLRDSEDYDRLAEESTFDESYWRAEVADYTNKKFALFYANKIIGMTTISFSEKLRADHACEFTGSYILHEYRGLKLGDLLYRTRLLYLREFGYAQKALVKIFNENIIAQRIAERNGFSRTDTIAEGDVKYYLYKHDLTSK